MSTIPGPATEVFAGTTSVVAKPHQILNDALAEVGATGGALMLVDPTGKQLEIWARLGPPHKRKTDPRFAVGDISIAGHVAATGEPYLCTDVTQDPYFSPTRVGPPNFRSLMVAPILLEGQVIGIISADHEQVSAFTQAHMNILLRYAEQMALALAQEPRLQQTLVSFHEIGVSLTRSSGEVDLADVLRKVARQAKQVLQADLVILYQYDAKNREVLVEGTGATIEGDLLYKDAPMKTRMHHDDVAWKIVDGGQSRFFTNAETDEFLIGNVPPREGQKERPRFTVRENIKSLAALVLRFGGEESVGVMFVNYRTRHEFTLDEARILETFANYAAIAIQNAQLFQMIRQEAREQLVAVEQLAVLNSIAPTFAHKLSNAAGTIPVAVQEIRRKVNAPGPYVQSQLDRIEADAKELLQMANQLRQGLQAGAPERISNLLEVLASVKAQIASDYPTLSLNLQVPSSLPPIRSIRSHLQEVFLNLARNAAEATLPEPGQLVIHAHPNENGRFLEVEFSDTGRGIHPEHQRRIFDLGFTTKPKRGMGFGLWWCQTVLRSQGGDIRLKSSQSGKGTTFLIRLPVAHDE